MCNTSTANNPDTIGILAFCSQHCGRDSFGSGKINNFTILIQVIKFTHPITTDCKDIYIIFLNIINLLTKIVLNDHLVSISSCFNRFNSFKNIVSNIQFSTTTVKAITSNTNNKIIS